MNGWPRVSDWSSVPAIFCMLAQTLTISTFEIGCRARIMALHILQCQCMGSCLDAWWASFLASLPPPVIWRAQCAALVAREAWQKDLTWKFVKTSKPSARAAEPLASAAASLCKKRCLLAAVRTVSSMVNPVQILDPRLWWRSISDSLPFSDGLEGVAWQQCSVRSPAPWEALQFHNESKTASGLSGYHIDSELAGLPGK